MFGDGVSQSAQSVSNDDSGNDSCWSGRSGAFTIHCLSATREPSFTAQHDYRIDSRGASSGQVGGQKSDADENGDR